MRETSSQIGAVLPPIYITQPSIDTYVDIAMDIAKSTYMEADEWQHEQLKSILSIREDGKWAHKNYSIVLSRQNGKGAVLELRELLGLFILDEQIVHTAHLQKTSAVHFKRMRTLINSNPELAAQVKYRRANGQEAIIRVDPQTGEDLNSISFVTRTKGGGRGDSVDLIVFDEAMYLVDEQMEALLFSASASDSPTGPQMIYTGSAGDRASIVFGRMRRLALNGAPGVGLAEWSITVCDEQCNTQCDVHDDYRAPETWAKVNPSMSVPRAGALDPDWIKESELAAMSKEGFLKERLGVGDWPVEGDGWRVISAEEWKSRHDSESVPKADRMAFSVDINPEATWSAIGVAGYNEDGLIHGEIPTNGRVMDHRQGTSWVAPRLIELAKKFNAPVAIDEGTQCKYLVDILEGEGIEVMKMSTRDVGEACGRFLSMVVPRKNDVPEFVHSDQPTMTVALAGADKRLLSRHEMWAWGRVESSTDITPLVAVTNAVWALTQPRKPVVAAPFISRLKRR